MNTEKSIESHHYLLKELTSLSSSIAEQMCTPDVNLSEEITNNLGDVYFRLGEIMNFYNKQKVIERCHSNPKTD